MSPICSPEEMSFSPDEEHKVKTYTASVLGAKGAYLPLCPPFVVFSVSSKSYFICLKMVLGQSFGNFSHTR